MNQNDTVSLMDPIGVFNEFYSLNTSEREREMISVGFLIIKNQWRIFNEQLCSELCSELCTELCTELCSELFICY